VPAPKALLVDADGAATGRPLFLMEYVAGAVPTPQTMNALVPERTDRISLIHQLAVVGAAIHSAPVQKLPADLRGRAASGVTAEVDYWERAYHRDRRAPIPILDWAFGWLRRNGARVSGRAVLVHGDLRVGNFIVGRQNIIAAVLDWEGAHIGDPVEDLANCCMRLHGGGPDTVSGVIGVQEFLQAYERSAGWSVPRETFDYWRIFCDVRSAIVFITAARRFEDGRTDDLRYAVLGQQLPILLEHIVKDLSSISGDMRPST
jgi:aminoglycoside phosphotransferase (APT) family kinase protein